MRVIKKIFIPILVFGSLWLIQCKEELGSAVVTAQVAKTLSPESNTATVIAGRTAIYNLFIAQPSDTSFGNIFPVSVKPITGASVKINDISLPEKVDGVYFKPAFDLQYMQRYDLYITTDTEIITGSCLLPDSFSITMPVAGDSVVFFDARVVWTRSDSTEHYILDVSPVDPANKARGWTKDFPVDSTSCLIPEQTFMDTTGNFFPGEYMISIMSFNGAWKKGSLDLFLSGGNLNGAPGLFGAAVYAKTVVVNIRGI